jgi:hypothetical protein
MLFNPAFDMEEDFSTFSKNLNWCVSILIGTEIGEFNGAVDVFLVVIFSFLAAVLLMNMLVARMGYTQEKLKNVEDVTGTWRIARARIIKSIQVELDLLLDKYKERFTLQLPNNELLMFRIQAAAVFDLKDE